LTPRAILPQTPSAAESPAIRWGWQASKIQSPPRPFQPDWQRRQAASEVFAARVKISPLPADIDNDKKRFGEKVTKLTDRIGG
jgi:hypothetical protein